MDILDAPRAYDAGVELLSIRFDFNMELDGPGFDVLSDDERARARRFVRHEDAIRCAATRAVLRRALAERTGMPASELRFGRGALGRPLLVSAKGILHAGLDFNVSHSGQHGLIALATGRRVGVDIEMCCPDVNWQMIKGAVFASRDDACVAVLPALQRVDAFYRVWTAKEALLKVLGLGIAKGMTWFSVLEGEHEDPFVRVISRQLDDAGELSALNAAWCGVPPGYVGCVAWSESGPR
ncbi:4'-phosphopantetheinyl transferase superfamily protein [Paraburkholderia steynii]|nr:4'-phosphopantetheinyl transferase superfamily protein [Paraburkholderia steynii]